MELQSWDPHSAFYPQRPTATSLPLELPGYACHAVGSASTPQLSPSGAPPCSTLPSDNGQCLETWLHLQPRHFSCLLWHSSHTGYICYCICCDLPTPGSLPLNACISQGWVRLEPGTRWRGPKRSGQPPLPAGHSSRELEQTGRSQDQNQDVGVPSSVFATALNACPGMGSPKPHGFLDQSPSLPIKSILDPSLALHWSSLGQKSASAFLIHVLIHPFGASGLCPGVSAQPSPSALAWVLPLCFIAAGPGHCTVPHAPILPAQLLPPPPPSSLPFLGTPFSSHLLGD